MSAYIIQIDLLSDTTFGRGDGLPGSIDREVEHDRLGLPYLRGRTLKGLLSEEVDHILYNLKRIKGGSLPPQIWVDARQRLFGQSGSQREMGAVVHYGHAMFGTQLRQTVREAISAGRVSRQDILEALTAVRRQTAVETSGEQYGVPVKGSLRSMRVIMRETTLMAQLSSLDSLSANEEGLLAVGVMGLRRAGTGRNRGRGYLRADLLQEGTSILQSRYQHFVDAAGLSEQAD